MLVLARQPWAQPAASLYRFLPVERLREGVVHEIQIHNAAATSTELVRITIEDEPVAPPPGYERIFAESLLQPGARLPLSIEAGTMWTHPLLLRAGELPLPESSLGWFSAIVRHELLFNSEPQEVVTRLSGALGRGPSLELQGSGSITATGPDHETQHSFTFRNPGQIPVEVQEVRVLRGHDGHDGPAPNPDWLVLAGLEAGDVVGPGEERTLVVRYRPEARPPDELLHERNRRAILIRHDGWQDATARQQLCRVVAIFGGAQEGTLGIDFGTSNSVACLMGEERAYPLILEIDGKRPEQLASLMYFNDSLAGVPRPEPVLYGEEARGAANTEPANLVRSIKTVVIDGARTEYSFQRKGADGNVQNLSLTPQGLLNLFIRKLRTLAEHGVEHLSPEILDEERLSDRRVTFRNAVFSHPVEMTDTMKEALMQAAHSAGINTDIQTPEEFFQERCVDEATAAVLAYINQVLLDHSQGEDERELKDLERILCIDVGGGTTDIAAVAVKDMAAYRDGTAPKVTVELWTRDGDRRFAGDALDRLLAKEILGQIEEQSREQGAPVLVEEVMYAILSPSFMAYQLHFKERFKGDSRRRNAVQTDAHAAYSLAARVLEAAEAAKQAFTSEAQVTKSFTGSGWPRLQDDPSAAAKNFEVVLKREVFEKIVRRELGQRFRRLNAVIAGARWEWTSVTTLLLTGQSMKSAIIRQPVVEYVREKMGEAAETLVVVEPADAPGASNGFDPKACVAIGAAIWGISRIRDDPWLVIERPFLE
ncbi:MAG TPA: Hsp70 family protein, partial [Thermoanaerobaculia bacterium]|nr:Hsp70 family protein [Thermoanaerobaculia bacterium]